MLVMGIVQEQVTRSEKKKLFFCKIENVCQLTWWILVHWLLIMQNNLY